MIISACKGTSSSDIDRMNPEDSVLAPDVDLSSLENENPEDSTGIEEETVISEHQKILSGQIGTVNFTALSENDKANFNGKEMIADAEYIEKVFSSDVYCCAEPLKRMEVHPILE
jgi:hypothetical protein